MYVNHCKKKQTKRKETSPVLFFYIHLSIVWYAALSTCHHHHAWLCHTKWNRFQSLQAVPVTPCPCTCVRVCLC